MQYKGILIKSSGNDRVDIETGECPVLQEEILVLQNAFGDENSTVYF